MGCKTSLFLLNKINYFYLHWFIAEKSAWSSKEKERCDSELVSSKSSLPQFYFHLCNTVVAVDLLVVTAVGKNAQQQ